jgi:succinyl-diaminopimelate desuccinylase
LLAGHLDTVPHQGQPEPYVQDGRMHGLGTSDMKSGLAVMIHLLEDAEVQAGPFNVVGVFYDMEEGPIAENQLSTILDEVPWLLDAEFAVVMESTDLEIEVGCNGAINVVLRVHGKSAHAARPWMGVNAITKAIPLLQALEQFSDRPVAIDGLVFHEVMNPTLIAGGVARNVLPKDFEINVNYRFPPNCSLEEAQQRLRDVVGDLADEIEFTDLAPSGPVPRDNPHLERLAVVSGAQRNPKQGWTDVAQLAQYGIPAVNYGPGDPKLAHQLGESVELANLPAAFEVLKRFLT